MKTKSNRIRYYEQTFMKHENFQNDPVSFIFWGIALIVFASLYGRTVISDPSLTFFDALFIVMLVVGLLAGLPFFLWEHYENEGRIGLYFIDLKTVNIKVVLSIGICFGVVMGIDFAVNAIEALTSIEQLLFYTFAAVAEEFFYRYFIATSIYLVAFKILKSVESKKMVIAEAFIVITCAIITTLVTSVFFYFSHFTAYGGRDLILLGIFLASAAFTIVYLYTKTINASLIVHLIVNFFYAAIIFFGSFTVIG